MKHRYLPFRISLIYGLLAVLFTFVTDRSSAQSNVIQNQQKFGRLLRLIDSYYVDTANVEKLTEKAIINILSDLDPHSTYISREEVEKMNEPLKGNFEGIGISFNIFKDTLLVTSTISGGPSEKVGLKAGDRIMEVEGENIAGIGLKTSDVYELLRGKKGTIVNLKVLRNQITDMLEFKIIRDKIPIFSLDASYMMDNSTGYIKLRRFSATTESEFESAMNKLKVKNIKNLILDLRDNTGGYLKTAHEISDQFLSDDQLIVYTDGINEAKREYKSSSKGLFKEGNLIVLVNEYSASASEIVSGAVQDWDRGIIIGRRTFGKGLVQKQFFLTDGSVVRLTTGHYYTPSGRCIQKPYEEGTNEYRKDVRKRITSGELFNADSVYYDETQRYKTLINGRSVFGGGGVMPDIFIPMDTSSHYSYVNKLRGKYVILNYALGYVDQNRDQIKGKYPDFNEFEQEFEVSEDMIDEIASQGLKEEIEINQESLDFSKESIKKEVKALIARDVYSRNDFYKVLNKDDKAILKAIEVFKNQNAYNDMLVAND